MDGEITSLLVWDVEGIKSWHMKHFFLESSEELFVCVWAVEGIMNWRMKHFSLEKSEELFVYVCKRWKTNDTFNCWHSSCMYIGVIWSLRMIQNLSIFLICIQLYSCQCWMLSSVAFCYVLILDIHLLNHIPKHRLFTENHKYNI